MKWLGLCIVFLVAAFAINKNLSKQQPNQLLSFKVSTASVFPEKDLQYIQEKLLELGVSDFVIETTPDNAVSIKYYSSLNTSFIKSYLQTDFNINVNEISKLNPFHSGFDGVIIIEQKNEICRHIDVKLTGDLLSFKYASTIKWFKTLKQNIKCLSTHYSNTSHNVANVRAGPLA